MRELKVPATLENIETVTDFVNEYLETLDCPMKIQMKIAIAIDEVFSNIVYYAYGAQVGDVIICVEKLEQPHGVVLTFTDKGVPYNPLEKEDPDTSLSLEERALGGMGIFMVKNIMDDVSYSYINGQNVLKIMKKI